MENARKKVFRFKIRQKSVVLISVIFIFFSIPLLSNADGGPITCFGLSDCDIRGCPSSLVCPDDKDPSICSPICVPDGGQCPELGFCSNWETEKCAYEDTSAPTADISYSGGWNNGTFSITLTATDPSSAYCTTGLSSGEVQINTKHKNDASWSGWSNHDSFSLSGNSDTRNINSPADHCYYYRFRYQTTDHMSFDSGWADPGTQGKVDLVDPWADISYPTAGESSPQSSLDVLITLSEGDDTEGYTCSGVSSGEVQIRSKPLGAAETNWTSWTFHRSGTGNFTFTGSDDMCYRFRYRTTDNAGNNSSWDEEARVCIHLCSNDKPDIPSLVAPAPVWMNTNPTFTANVSDPNGDDVRAEFQVSGWGSGSGNRVNSGQNSSWGPVNITTDGNYQWRAKAVDYNPECALSGDWSSYRWLGIDKTPPNCDSMTISPLSPDENDQVTFTVNASDATSGVASIEIFVDGNPVKSCNSTTCSYTGGPYSAGNHTYSATVTDNAGNTDPTPCSGNFNVQVLGVSCGLSASPDPFGPSGFSPELRTTVSGTASGATRYQLDCESDGTIDEDITLPDAQDPYWPYNGCSYTSDKIARVTVTREGLSTNCTVNLYISTFDVTPDLAGVTVGGTIQFVANYDSDGPNGSEASTDVASLANWSSDDAGVATIDSNGLAKGEGIGSTIITANYDTGTGILSDTATLNVGPRISSYRVVLSGFNRPPTADNLNVSAPPDWCATQPNYSFIWDYNDLDNDTESGFDFRIDNDSGFGSPEVDRSYTNLSWPSGTQNTQSVPVVVNPASGSLTYAETYYWQVMVWDSNNTNSGWVDGVPFSFITKDHRYPVCDFTWSPNTPNPDVGTKFTDNSTCYDPDGVAGDCCQTGPGCNDSFSWSFPTGNPTNSPIENPVTTFSSSGDHQATLTVTDADNNSCTVTKNLRVNLPLPKWKEIIPF